MIASIVLVGISAMVFYAICRKGWLAISIPALVGLAWLASYMGAFKGDSTATGMFVGFSPLFAVAYAGVSALGVAITSGFINRKNEDE